MLTREEFIVLYRKYRHTKVLSIYLDADEHDPAKRRAWRRRLDQLLEQLEPTIEDRADREAYDKALALLKKELRRYDAFLPDRGWAGFATADELIYAETLPVPMPDLARWELGLRAAPYVRALKQALPVTTVLVDSRQARLFRYVQGEFEELEPVQADMFFGDLSDVNMSKRAATHTGVRGMTDADAAQRFASVGADRLLKHLVERIRDRDSEGTVVVGGTREMTAALIQRLPRALDGRVYEDPTIAFHTPLAELKRATEAAASTVTIQRHAKLVDQVIDAARSGGRGCLGRQATEQALRERRVESLLVSRRLARDDPEYVDFCVGTAFEQDAAVEELNGEPAAKLDAAGEGIGARLRF